MEPFNATVQDMADIVLMNSITTNTTAAAPAIPKPLDLDAIEPTPTPTTMADPKTIDASPAGDPVNNRTTRKLKYPTPPSLTGKRKNTEEHIGPNDNIDIDVTTGAGATKHTTSSPEGMKIQIKNYYGEIYEDADEVSNEDHTTHSNIRKKRKFGRPDPLPNSPSTTLPPNKSKSHLMKLLLDNFAVLNLKKPSFEYFSLPPKESYIQLPNGKWVKQLQATWGAQCVIEGGEVYPGMEVEFKTTEGFVSKKKAGLELAAFMGEWSGKSIAEEKKVDALTSGMEGITLTGQKSDADNSSKNGDLAADKPIATIRYGSLSKNPPPATTESSHTNNSTQPNFLPAKKSSLPNISLMNKKLTTLGLSHAHPEYYSTLLEPKPNDGKGKSRRRKTTVWGARCTIHGALEGKRAIIKAGGCRSKREAREKMAGVALGWLDGVIKHKSEIDSLASVFGGVSLGGEGSGSVNPGSAQVKGADATVADGNKVKCGIVERAMRDLKQEKIRQIEELIGAFEGVSLEAEEEGIEAMMAAP